MGDSIYTDREGKNIEKKSNNLIESCVQVFQSLKVTEDEVSLIENHTKEQSKSNLWFQARASVITASRFKQCCHTDLSQPSKSLILQVCYPSKHKFSTAATKYGIETEKNSS